MLGLGHSSARDRGSRRKVGYAFMQNVFASKRFFARMIKRDEARKTLRAVRHVRVSTSERASERAFYERPRKAKSIFESRDRQERSVVNASHDSTDVQGVRSHKVAISRLSLCVLLSVYLRNASLNI